MTEDYSIEERKKNVINISNICNQKCIFCSGYPEESISIEKVKELVDSAGKDVFFQGGEPTLQEELVDLIKYAKEKGKYVTLVTNGLRLRYRKYAKSLFDAGLDQVFFAFHAPDEKLNNFISSNEDSFKNKVKALENIKSLGKMGSVRLVYVISILNQHKIIDFTNFIKENFSEIGSIEMKLMQSLGNPEENSRLFPVIEDFIDELNRAVEECRDSGIKVQTNGIPLCYLGRNFKCSVEYFMKNKGVENLTGRIFLEKCAGCGKKKMCMGFRKDYIEIKGSPFS